MGERKLSISQESSKNESLKTIERYDSTITSELVFGICSPIGTDKKSLIDNLERQLKNDYGYDVKLLKLSSFIEKLEKRNGYIKNYEHGTESYKELKFKIDAGNHLRDINGNEFLAELSISKILFDRGERTKLQDPTTEDFLPSRTCHIIDSIKNKDELNLLRKIYGDVFYQFSVFTQEEERIEYLMEEKNVSKPEAEELIEQDEFEKEDWGQNVRDTFIEADFFVNLYEKSEVDIENEIQRYLDLIFECGVLTPYPYEQAMYKAKSASGNSACLSRQVGAAILNKENNLVSVGWNDVPKFGGNLYTEVGDSKNDFRCWNTKNGFGFCSNDEQKNKLVDKIFGVLVNDTEVVESFNEIIKKQSGVSIVPPIDSETFSPFREVLVKTLRRKTQLKDLIEFSRSVHAEMHAIINGSQLGGGAIIQGKLFCTTYPCHNCMRHIIASGIYEVYYIEPYKKSKGIELHGDSVSKSIKEDGKVKVRMYNGVAPRRFLKFFDSMNERKDKTGKLITPDKKKLTPKFGRTLQALHHIEVYAVDSLKGKGFEEDRLAEIV